MNEETAKAKDKALSLLNYRMRTKKELETRLLECGFGEESVNEAVAYAEKFGYINDKAYAEAYVLSRKDSKGEFLLKRELKEKGVPDEIIAGVFEHDETDVPKVTGKLLEKKYGAPHSLDEKEYRKAFSFLARRGFDSHDIYAALKEYTNA